MRKLRETQLKFPEFPSSLLRGTLTFGVRGAGTVDNYTDLGTKIAFSAMIMDLSEWQIIRIM